MFEAFTPYSLGPLILRHALGSGLISSGASRLYQRKHTGTARCGRPIKGSLGTTRNSSQVDVHGDDIEEQVGEPKRKTWPLWTIVYAYHHVHVIPSLILFDVPSLDIPVHPALLKALMASFVRGNCVLRITLLFSVRAEYLLMSRLHLRAVSDHMHTIFAGFLSENNKNNASKLPVRPGIVQWYVWIVLHATWRSCRRYIQPVSQVRCNHGRCAM